MCRTLSPLTQPGSGAPDPCVDARSLPTVLADSRENTMKFPAPGKALPRHLLCALLCAPLTLALAPAASAQTPRSTSPSPNTSLSADPLDPNVPLPALRYRSALQSYRADPGAELGTVLGDWKASNERVQRIGGWRAYAREANASPLDTSPANAAASAPASQGKPEPAPKAGGHSHHH